MLLVPILVILLNQLWCVIIPVDKNHNPVSSYNEYGTIDICGVCPGITAAAGICAELGIPMTHRGVATSVRFLTGHSREGGEGELDDTLVVSGDPHTTLIIYMGLNTLPSLTQRLFAHGMPRDTPAVAVEKGTTPEQRVVYASIAELAGDVARVGLKSPTLIIVGSVVACSPGWQASKGVGAGEGFVLDDVGLKSALTPSGVGVSVPDG